MLLNDDDSIDRLNSTVIFIALTGTTVLMAVLCDAHFDRLSAIQILAGVVAYVGGAIAMWHAVTAPTYDSPLVGAWVTLTVFISLSSVVQAAVGCELSPLNPFVQIIVGHFALVSVAALGMIGGAFLSLTGCLIGWILRKVRGRDDVWTGVICGGTIGMLHIPLYLGNDFSYATTVIRILLYAAIGGWGAAVQADYLHKYPLLKEALPSHVDLAACAATDAGQSRWYRLKEKTSYRIRNIMTLPSRIRRW